jgi:DNA-binding transcriptional ArsR family regulator
MVILASSLPSTARLVALVLSTHMNGAGGSCFPSLTTIARESGLSRSTVCGALAELEGGELVERSRRPGRVTHYRATSPAGGLALVRQANQPVREPDGSSPGAGPEDVQEDVHKDVTTSTRANARTRKKGAAKARPKNKSTDTGWEGIEEYDRA